MALTVAELNFYESVPRTLKDIANALQIIAGGKPAEKVEEAPAPQPETTEVKSGLSNLNPTWDEERKAVFIPIINKYLDAKRSAKEMTWDEAIAYVKKAGKEPPSQHEMFAILFFKDEINAILEEHGGDLLTEWAWSSSEYSANLAWIVYFYNGVVYVNGKYYVGYVRAVAAI